MSKTDLTEPPGARKARRTEVPCATCKTPVPIFDHTVSLVLACNAELKRRGERSLARSEVVLCATCYRHWQDARTAEHRQAAQLLSRVRAGQRPNPSETHWLRGLGYGYDLDQALAVAAETEPS